MLNIDKCCCLCCGGVLSTAFVSINTQANRFDEAVEGGDYEVTCDNCGFIQFAWELKEKDND